MSKRDLCIMACVFCKDPQFHAWLDAIDEQSARRKADGMPTDEAFAKAFIVAACNVKSRNELDTNPRAADLFHRVVRLPFLEWKAGLVAPRAGGPFDTEGGDA